MSRALPIGRAGRLLATGVTLLLAAAVWFGAVLPLLGWYADRADDLLRQEALLRRQTALAAALPAFEHAAQRMHRAILANDDFLGGATDAIAGATLEQLLQGMTSRSNATLSSAEALTPKPAGPYQRIQLRITVTSDWSALIKLLQAITTARPVMLVDNLQITATPEPTGAPPISAVFSVIAFRNGSVHPSNTESDIRSVTGP